MNSIDFSGYVKWMKLQPDVDTDDRWTRDPEILASDPIYKNLKDIVQPILSKIQDERDDITDLDVAVYRFSPNGKKALMGIGDTSGNGGENFNSLYFIDVDNKNVIYEINSECYTSAIRDIDGDEEVKWSMDANAFIYIDKEHTIWYFNLSDCSIQQIYESPYKFDLTDENIKHYLSNDGTKIARFFYNENEPPRLFIYNTVDHTDREISPNENWFMYIDWNAKPVNNNESYTKYYNAFTGDDVCYSELPVKNDSYTHKYFMITEKEGVYITQYIQVKNGQIIKSEYR